MPLKMPLKQLLFDFFGPKMGPKNGWLDSFALLDKLVKEQQADQEYQTCLNPDLGTRYFFPGSLIAKPLLFVHGSLSLKHYFFEFPCLLAAKMLLKKQWFSIGSSLNR